jgi:hypothetical protein
MKKQDLRNLIKENISDWLAERAAQDEASSGDMAYTEKAPLKEEEDTIEDQIGEFFVVEKATKNDEKPEDLYFSGDVFYLAQQMKGGLEKSGIHGIYKSEGKAKSTASKLLKDRDNQVKETYKKGQAKLKEMESSLDELKGAIEKNMAEATANPTMRETLQTKSNSLLEKLTQVEAMIEKLRGGLEKEGLRLEKKKPSKDKKENIEESKHVVRPCSAKDTPWAVWKTSKDGEDDKRVKGFKTKPEAQKFADEKNK